MDRPSVVGDVNVSIANPVLKQSLPITLTSFVNKCGDIGLRLFPMLLVEHQLKTDDASLVMALVKGATIFATLAGGVLGDKLGHRPTIILSFICSCVGMFALSVTGSVFMICAAGMIASFGQGMFGAPLRVLLVRTVEAGYRQEALGWLRSANNGAVMLANGVAYLTSGIGVGMLFLFDAVTSGVAAVLGVFLLPGKVSKKGTTIPPSVDAYRHLSRHARIACFVLITLILCFFTFQMEVYFVATAAQAKISFGDRGVEVFAQVMMLNTLICMIFTVPFSRYIKTPGLAFSFGLILQAVALAWFYLGRGSMSAFFISALFQVIGELVFTAVAQFTLLQLVPEGPREGRIYSGALFIQLLGKAVGAAYAFPLLASGNSWFYSILVLSVFFCVASFVFQATLRGTSYRRLFLFRCHNKVRR